MEATIDRNIAEIELLSEAIKLYNLQSKVLTESADIQVLNESISETIKNILEKLKELIDKIISSIKSKLSNSKSKLSNNNINLKDKKFTVELFTKNEMGAIKRRLQTNYQIALGIVSRETWETDIDKIESLHKEGYKYSQSQWSYNEIEAEISDVATIINNYRHLTSIMVNKFKNVNGDMYPRFNGADDFLSVIDFEIMYIKGLTSCLVIALDKLTKNMNENQ